MNKRVKTFLFALLSAVIVAVIALCILLAIGYRFSAKRAIHSYWRDMAYIEADEYTFWLNEVTNDDKQLIYAVGHQGVKQYGFLYKQIEKKEQKFLLNEYGDYIGSMSKYEGKSCDYYFIHWVQSATGIENGKYASSMRYYTDRIKVNGKNVILKYHCFFELGEAIETLVIKGETIMVSNDYEKPDVSLYAPKPKDTNLEFWITENVENIDFSSHAEIYGWMGAREFYGTGYAPAKDEDGNDIKPKHYVTYLITAYPDYADGGRFVTQITITDPSVSVYGLTVNSTLEEFTSVFREMGYFITVEDHGEHQIFQAKKYDGVYFIYDTGTSMLTIKANVTNKEGIQF